MCKQNSNCDCTAYVECAIASAWSEAEILGACSFTLLKVVFLDCKYIYADVEFSYVIRHVRYVGLLTLTKRMAILNFTLTYDFLGNAK